MRTIDEEWRDFAEAIPDTAGMKQRMDFRRVFYAGVTAGITLMGEGVPIERMVAEVEEFMEQVGEGEA